MAIRLALTSLPVFQFIAPAHTATLSAISRVIEKAAGEVVVMRGETVAGIYIVAAGSVGVYATQTPQPLSRLGVGGSFGEMSFLRNLTASATVRAEEPGTCLVLLGQQDLAAAVDADADLGRAFYRGLAVTLSAKLAATTDKIAAELTAGRALLQELGSGDAGAAELAQLPAAAAAHHERLARGLDAALHHAHELARRAGGEASERPLAPLAGTLAELKTACAAFQPRLTHQVGALVAFVQSLEDLAQFTGRS